jgi:hypothetical protein
MLFQMCGVFAEFERAMISERVRAGLERVRVNGPAKGKKAIGRPQNTDAALADRVKQMRAEGVGLLKIGRTLGIGTGLVQRIVTASWSDDREETKGGNCVQSGERDNRQKPMPEWHVCLLRSTKAEMSSLPQAECEVKYSWFIW